MAWTGPEDSEKPASATRIADVAEPTRADEGDNGSRTALYLAAGALILALLSLGLALRRPDAPLS